MFLTFFLWLFRFFFFFWTFFKPVVLGLFFLFSPFFWPGFFFELASLYFFVFFFFTCLFLTCFFFWFFWLLWLFCFEEIPPLFEPSQQYQKHHANDAEELECSFETKAHSEKSLNVSDVTVTDEDGYLSRSSTIKNKQQDGERTNLGYTSEDCNWWVNCFDWTPCVWTYSRSSRLHVRMSKKSELEQEASNESSMYDNVVSWWLCWTWDWLMWTWPRWLENLSYSLTVNEFAALTTRSDETESVSRYTGRQAQQCVEWPEALEKSTHTEIHDVDGAFSFPFNEVVQCTIDWSRVARTNRDVSIF